MATAANVFAAVLQAAKDNPRKAKAARSKKNNRRVS